MRAIITVTAFITVSLMALESSFAQAWSQINRYNRCVALASRQGLSAKSAKRPEVYIALHRRGTYGLSRNCPDDPRARSAYPSWMCHSKRLQG